MEAWLYRYTYKHGESHMVALAETSQEAEQRALLACADTIIEYLTGADEEEQGEIEALIQAGKLKEAVQLYNDFTDDRHWVEIEPIEII